MKKETKVANVAEVEIIAKVKIGKRIGKANINTTTSIINNLNYLGNTVIINTRNESFILWKYDIN